MQQEQKRRASSSKQSTVEEATAPTAQSSDDHHKAETDALLDEIDGLLEENAEEFVRNYTQKGGQ
jgi:ubiquitin-like protein Pup